jgi:hypothetical protein
MGGMNFVAIVVTIVNSAASAVSVALSVARNQSISDFTAGGNF